MNGQNYPARNVHSFPENVSSPNQVTKRFENMSIASSKPRMETNMPRFPNTINNVPNRYSQPVTNNLNFNQLVNRPSINFQKSDLNAPGQNSQFTNCRSQTCTNPVYSKNSNMNLVSSPNEIPNSVQSFSNTNQKQSEYIQPSNQNAFPKLNQSMQPTPLAPFPSFNPPAMNQLPPINSSNAFPPLQNTTSFNSPSNVYQSPMGNINGSTYPSNLEQFNLRNVSKSTSNTVPPYMAQQTSFPGMPQRQPHPTNSQPFQSPPGFQTSQGMLNANLIPDPIVIMEEDRKLRNMPFHTNVRGQVPPLVTTDFIVRDEGNSSPKFLCSTIYNVPCQYELLKQSYLPFAIVITPFSKLHDQEIPPPISDLGGFGPTRCNRCKAYMCPYMKFIDGGRRFQCAFCDGYTEVPQEYFAYLDNMGQRTDKYQRPELCLGSYEFIATTDYCKNEKFPNPPAFIFIIDVSYNNIKNGIVQLLCQNMKLLLKELPKEGDAEVSAIKVGFVTYSNAVHFFNIKEKLTQPQMLTVSDIEDMFVPLIDGFFVSLEEAESVIDSLMEQIPIIFADSIQTEIVLAPAIQAGLEALKAADRSGKLFVFHSTLPTAEAPGKLRNREDRALLGTEKEKMITNPQIPYYTKLGEECVAAGCSVDLFLFPNSYVDVATIGELCRVTGGQIRKYSFFQAPVDGERLIDDVKNVIRRSTVFDAVMRVRTSAGIRATNFYGDFYMANTTDLEIASLDDKKSITAEIKYDDKLQEEAGTYLQVATLYTSCSGQRRIRLHNLSLNTCSQMMDLFRGASGDAIIHFFIKRALKLLLEEPPQQVKESIRHSVVGMLAAFKKACTSQLSYSQLLLPENLKLLPLYVNCLLKSDAISGGPDLTADERSLAMSNANGIDLYGTVCYLYPRLVSLTNLDIKPTDIPLLRCSASNIKENGAYLLENGTCIFIWVGQAIDANWIQDVFSVQYIGDINPAEPIIPENNNPLSRSIRSLIERIRKESGKHLQLFVVRQGDRLDAVFRRHLVEDRGNRGTSYPEYFNQLQGEVSQASGKS
ncbi:protein transport protein Sec24C-like [Centruroides vittatus]|uniref:protein transport protein Sec24C-like n=1 Tax=Centruroides vittatus TaxID=120091 RepID=UPI00350F30AB